MNDDATNDPVIDAEEILEGVLRWVEIESPSHEADAVNQMVDHVEEGLAVLGLQMERTPGRDGFGDILSARTPWGGDLPGILVLSHLDTVHAIGHPSGMTYTLTEGIISSIRRLASSYDPGGPHLLFVQTDVAINPGNSGGPLYVGDKVIGVNTKKLAKVDLEGLAFSVHVSEVMRFLEEFHYRDK